MGCIQAVASAAVRAAQVWTNLRERLQLSSEHQAHTFGTRCACGEAMWLGQQALESDGLREENPQCRWRAHVRADSAPPRRYTVPSCRRIPVGGMSLDVSCALLGAALENSRAVARAGTVAQHFIMLAAKSARLSSVGTNNAAFREPCVALQSMTYVMTYGEKEEHSSSGPLGCLFLAYNACACACSARPGDEASRGLARHPLHPLHPLHLCLVQPTTASRHC